MASVKSFKVIKNFRAPKKGSYPVKFREFKEGMSFSGSEDMSNKPPLVADEDGFLIPLNYVVVMEVEEESDSNGSEKNDPSEEISKNIDKIKNNDIVKTVMDSSKYSVNGVIAGAVFGGVIALYYKKSFLWCAIGGAVAGGFIGGYISNKKSK